MSNLSENPEIIGRVFGSNKTRDLQILCAIADGIPQKTVAECFGLADSTISEIKKHNYQLWRELVMQTGLADAAERIHKLKTMIYKKGDATLKDAVDMMGELRKEINGDGFAFPGSQTVIQINVKTGDKAAAFDAALSDERNA